MMYKSFLHCLAGNGFYKISVKSRLIIQLSVLTSRICGQNDDRSIPVKTSGLNTQLLQALYSIHLRHQMIHEYRIVMYP